MTDHTNLSQAGNAVKFSQLSLLDKIVYSLGVGLGSGLSPKAPGTVGSLAVLVFVPLWVWLGFYPSLLIMLAMSVVGIWICGRTAEMMQVHDDGRIVWDEFAGQSITLLPLLWLDRMSWWGVLLAFGLFRLFDIWKPLPIGYADRQLHGGFGIMMDDILAGIISAAVLYGALILSMNYGY